MDIKNEFKISKKFIIRLIIVLLLIIFIPLFLKLIWFVSTKTDIIADRIESSNKEKLCEEEILKNLKAPWSAKFWKKPMEWIITIKNYVDSQNSYGALLRKYFICEFSSDGTIDVFFEDDSIESNKIFYNMLNETEFSWD